MTIIISIPGDVAEMMRALLPFVEPFVLAVAAACGAGVLVQLGLDIGVRLVQRALRP